MIRFYGMFLKILILSLMACFFISCSNKLKNLSSNKIETAERFYKYMSDGMGDEAFKMLNHDIYDENRRRTVRWDARTVHKYAQEYGETNKSQWYLEYDTLHPVSKLEYIVIPIYNGQDKSRQVKKISLRIGFDMTSQFIPDTVVSDYSVGNDLMEPKGNAPSE
jgi:hypothetical protein